MTSPNTHTLHPLLDQSCRGNNGKPKGSRRTQISSGALLPGMRQIAPSNSGAAQTHLPNFFFQKLLKMPVTIATTSFLRSPWQLARTDAQFFSCPEAPPFSQLHPKTRTAGAASSEEELVHGGGCLWPPQRLLGQSQTQGQGIRETEQLRPASLGQPCRDSHHNHLPFIPENFFERIS